MKLLIILAIMLFSSSFVLAQSDTIDKQVSLIETNITNGSLTLDQGRELLEIQYKAATSMLKVIKDEPTYDLLYKTQIDIYRQLTKINLMKLQSNTDALNKLSLDMQSENVKFYLIINQKKCHPTIWKIMSGYHKPDFCKNVR